MLHEGPRHPMHAYAAERAAAALVCIKNRPPRQHALLYGGGDASNRVACGAQKSASENSTPRLWQARDIESTHKRRGTNMILPNGGGKRGGIYPNTKGSKAGMGEIVSAFRVYFLFQIHQPWSSKLFLFCYFTVEGCSTKRARYCHIPRTRYHFDQMSHIIVSHDIVAALTFVDFVFEISKANVRDEAIALFTTTTELYCTVLYCDIAKQYDWRTAACCVS